MATFRVGVGSFNLKDGAIGIGTEASGHGELKVEGTIKSDQLEVIGVSTFIRYSGFSANEISIGSSASQFVAQNTRNLTLPKEYQSTGDIIVEDGSTLTVGLGSTTCLGSLEYVCVKHHFSVPTGDTSNRNRTAGYVEGTIRYNTDLGTMEFFNGNEWRQFTYISDIQNSPSTRGRGLLAGGNNPAMVSDISFINIMSAGDAQNFGELTTARTCRATSSETRALFSGGYVSPTGSNIIDYITMASSGNAINFGDSTHQRRNHAMLSSSTRAIIAGGESPATINVMDYVEIGTLGNALDFGDLSQARYGNTGMSSPVRGIFACDQSDYNTTSVEFITIASKGNAKDFGELDDSRSNAGSASNGVRGIVAGGYNGGSRLSLVSACTMASTGNFISFGNLVKAADRGDGMCNSTRAVFNGGYPSNANGMDVIEFASGGSGATFGSDTVERGQSAGFCSDSHGGLGGY